MPYTGPERRRTRANWHDYGDARVYFVTIVAQHRTCWFGEVVDGAVCLSPAGQMVLRVWEGLSDRHSRMRSEAMVLMPNHLHALLRLLPAKDDDRFSLSEAVGWFKSVTTTRYAAGVRGEGWPPFDRHLWQPSFHDRVVRTHREHEIFARYIRENPVRWKEDSFHEPDTFDWMSSRVILPGSHP